MAHLSGQKTRHSQFVCKIMSIIAKYAFKKLNILGMKAEWAFCRVFLIVLCFAMHCISHGCIYALLGNTKILILPALGRNWSVRDEISLHEPTIVVWRSPARNVFKY